MHMLVRERGASSGEPLTWQTCISLDQDRSRACCDLSSHQGNGRKSHLGAPSRGTYRQLRGPGVTVSRRRTEIAVSSTRAYLGTQSNGAYRLLISCEDGVISSPGCQLSAGDDVGWENAINR